MSDQGKQTTVRSAAVINLDGTYTYDLIKTEYEEREPRWTVFCWKHGEDMADPEDVECMWEVSGVKNKEGWVAFDEEMARKEYARWVS